MKFIVRNRSDLQCGYCPGIPHILISITSPSMNECLLRDNPNRKAVLRLQFDDIERFYHGYKRMTLEQAQQIVDFVREHQDSVEAIVVHCEAGISRSAGVAAALAWVMTGDDSQFYDPSQFPNDRHYMPNNLCRALVVRAWEGGRKSAFGEVDPDS